MQLEDGAKVMWQVYKSVIDFESMFTDESVFHEYVAMSFNCLKKNHTTDYIIIIVMMLVFYGQKMTLL